MKIDISRYEDEDNVFYVPVPIEWISDVMEHPVIKFMALRMAARWFVDQNADIDFDGLAEWARKIHNGEIPIQKINDEEASFKLMRQFDSIARFLTIYVKRRNISQKRREAVNKRWHPERFEEGGQ